MIIQSKSKKPKPSKVTTDTIDRAKNKVLLFDMICTVESLKGQLENAGLHYESSTKIVFEESDLWYSSDEGESTSGVEFTLPELVNGELTSYEEKFIVNLNSSGGLYEEALAKLQAVAGGITLFLDKEQRIERAKLKAKEIFSKDELDLLGLKFF